MPNETVHYCPECGSYQAQKPLIEWNRRADIRAWEINIYRHEVGGRDRGMQIVVTDRGEWLVGQPQDLIQGVAIVGPR